MADKYTDRFIGRWMGRTTRRPTMAMDDVAREARESVEESRESTEKFREQRAIDRGFMERQYSDEEIRQRGTQRPALQLHPIIGRLQQQMHDFRTAGIGFRIGSATSETGSDAAAIYNGLALRDQRDSLSDAAMEEIIREAALYGEGWGQWRIVDKDDMRVDASPMLFADSATPMTPALSLGAFDKRLRLRACSNDSVFEDPHDTTPDRRDMNFLVEVERVTLERRNAMFPKAERLPPEVFEADDELSKFWFPTRAGSSGPARDQMVRLAYYYRRTRVPVDYVWAPGMGGEMMREDGLSPEHQAMVAAAGAEVIRRTINADKVTLTVTDGVFSLTDPYELPWGRIPYFRAVSEELTLNDGERLKRGLVYYLRDLNKWMSVSASDVIYKQSVAGQDGWYGPDEATREFRADWRDPTVPKGYRRYRAFSNLPGPQGTRQPIPPPQYHTNQPAIEAGIASIAGARELIAMTSGSADGQDRDVGPGRPQSAVALDRMDRMAATNRDELIWKAEHITAQASGDIWHAMSPHVYDRPGMLVYVAGARVTDADEGVIIGIPFIRVNGKPTPLDPAAVGDLDQIPDPQNPDVKHDVIRFDPRKESVKVTTHATNIANAGRAALSEVLANLITARPELTPALAEPLIASLADRFPVDDVLDRIKAMFPEPIDPSEGIKAENLPAVVKQLQTQIEQQQQAMQELQQAADTTQAARQIEAMKAENSKAIAELREEWATERELLKIEAQREKTFVDASVKGQSTQDTIEASAAVEGMKLGAQAAQQERGQDDGRGTGGTGTGAGGR